MTSELAAREKPVNVVFILTDNQGAWTLGCYGNPEISTPHIDRMASEGLLMTQAFSSNPVCSPTRATFLTGLIPSQHGVHCFLRAGRLQMGPEARNTLAEFTSLPEVLKSQGYRCGLVGKWHLGGNLQPQEGLDDYWVTMPHGGTAEFYDAEVIEDGQLRREPRSLTDYWTDHAVKFIEQQDERPFFLYLAYNGPYALGRLLLNEPRNRHAARYAEMELTCFPRENPHAWQFNNLDYMNNPVSLRRIASEVSGVDDGVGRVMQALREQGLDENTLVIYASDQGWVGGQGGFFGMGDHTRPITACDGMMQIPMIWRHPGGIPDGRTSDLMVSNYDFLPTVLGYLGLTREQSSGDKNQEPESPGRDFAALLRGESPGDWANEVFYEFEFLRCIRTDRWKLVRRYHAGPNELFDLRNDPLEETNLIADSAHQAVRKKLQQRLDEFYKRHANPKYDLLHGGGAQTVLFHPAEPPEGAPPETNPQPDATAVSAVPGNVPPPERDTTDKSSLIQLPEGYTVERVAGPPLVKHPMLAGFDERGRLFVAESAGLNLRRDDLEKELPNSIRLLEDTNGDGIFDKATTFADNMTFPQGALWYRGALYVASSPNIWRLEDTNGDGVADKREILVSGFGYTGNAADVHGCFLGPDGRIYWCDGRHGHEFRDAQGNLTREGKGSYIFSCRPDGSDVRPHCGGGMDNPVEIDFTETGDIIGTVNILYSSPRSDALVHWLYGGTYPHSQRVLGEFKKTGDLLGPIHEFGHVAVSGTARYRSGLLDRSFRDNYFVTIFNTGKLLRCEVTQDQTSGSTYAARQFEFLSCSDPDFHPTDVLEDADGSLLLIDTGGWFRIGCPQSVVAKPEIAGGIYRIRRTGMPTFVDPRGLRIDWAGLDGGELLALLGDTRHAVRERAIDECALRGDDLVPLLERAVQRQDILPRRNAVWALTRIDSDAARKGLRHAFTDRDASVRAAACHSAAITQDANAFAALIALLDDASPHVRRQALAALGRIGNPEAVPHLLDRAAAVADRAEEHALIFALIEINDAQRTREGLTGPVAATRKAALIALDQMDDQQLTPQQISRALHDEEGSLREVAIGILMDRPEWAGTVAETLRTWLGSERSPLPELALRRLCSAFIGTPEVAALIGSSLADPELSSGKRRFLLQAVAESTHTASGAAWTAPLRSLLTEDDEQLVQQTIQAVRKLPVSEFQEALLAIVNDERRAESLRLGALEAAAPRGTPLSDAGFTLTLRILERRSPSDRVEQSARILGGTNLTPKQLERLLPLLPTAGPLELRDLVRPFSRANEPALLASFADALLHSRARVSLMEKDLSELTRRWPETAVKLLDPLRGELQQQETLREQRLTDLVPFARQGRADRGEKIFFSEQAKCATCHRVGVQGGKVGPDLTGIGRIRLERDLLEAILYPSLSFAREYEPYSVATATGHVYNGLIVNETEETLFIQQQTGEPIPVLRADVEVISPSTVSIMPQGLETGLTPEQLGDLVAYLRSLQGRP